MAQNFKNPKNFNTFAEAITNNQGLTSLLTIASEIKRITQLIHRLFPQFSANCHCGAVDYPNDTLVIYVLNNAAFYLLNNSISLIQAGLERNGVVFAKILIKVKPQNYQAKPVRNVVSQEQYVMLAKLANAINRPDLLKPLDAKQLDDEKPVWYVELN